MLPNFSPCLILLTKCFWKFHHTVKIKENVLLQDLANLCNHFSSILIYLLLAMQTFSSVSRMWNKSVTVNKLYNVQYITHNESLLQDPASTLHSQFVKNEFLEWHKTSDLTFFWQLELLWAFWHFDCTLYWPNYSKMLLHVFLIISSHYQRSIGHWLWS